MQIVPFIAMMEKVTIPHFRKPHSNWMASIDPLAFDHHYCCSAFQIFHGVKVMHIPVIAQCILYFYPIKLSLVRK
ncbi:MAG TPA: hypothetical protein VGE97_09875 [Nitrososphaera sp.]|jgi:hypothetical protein